MKGGGSIFEYKTNCLKTSYKYSDEEFILAHQSFHSSLTKNKKFAHNYIKVCH